MSFKTTIALLAVLFVVAAHFVALELWVRPGREAESERDPGQMLIAADAVPVEDVTGIELRRGERTVKLERRRDGWMQIEPVRFAIEEEAALRLISAAGEVRVHRAFEPGTGDAPPRSELGLDPPRATLRLQWASGGDQMRGVVFHFGDRLTDGRGFATLEGQAGAFLVSGRMLDRVLRADPRQWRPQRLGDLGIPAARHASMLALADRQRQILLQRDDDAWRFAGGDPAESDRIDQMLERLAEMEIGEYLSDDPAALSGYGLDRPWRTVQIRRPSPALTGPDEDVVLTLRIGDEAAGSEDGYYASFSEGEQPSPVVFRLSRSQVEGLDIEPDQMRNPELVRMPLTSVARLRWADEAGEPVEITRDGDYWHFTEGDPGFQPGNRQVFRLVSALLTAEAEAYHDAPRPQQSPVRTVTVAGTMGDELEEIEFYRVPDEVGADEADLPMPVAPGIEQMDADDQWLAYRQDERVGYLVAREDVAPIFDPVVSLRSEHVFTPREEEVEAVTLHRPGGYKLRFIAEQTDPHGPVYWTLEGEQAHDDRTRRRLFESLFTLRADRWLDEVPEAGEQWHRIVLDLRDDRSRELLVDPESGRAVLDDRHGVKVDDDLSGYLTSELRDRRAIPARRADLRKVKITGTADDDATMTLDIDDHRIESDHDDFDHDAALRLLDVLAPMHVEQYIEDDEAHEPLRRIELTTREGQQYTLEVLEQRPLAIVNEQRVQLDEQTWRRLQEPLVTE